MAAVRELENVETCQEYRQLVALLLNVVVCATGVRSADVDEVQASEGCNTKPSLGAVSFTVPLIVGLNKVSITSYETVHKCE